MKTGMPKYREQRKKSQFLQISLIAVGCFKNTVNKEESARNNFGGYLR